MTVLYVIFPLALIVAAIAVGAFIWAARAGQFDDMDTPAMRASPFSTFADRVSG